ncbi:MAG: thioredoxin-like domain-containing protein [Candidatus Kapaibacterium sp.]
MKTRLPHLSLLALFALLLPLTTNSQTTLTGHISQGDGTAPAMAHLHLFPLNGGIGMKPLQTVPVGRDGNFTMKVDEPGYYRVAVTATDHDYCSVPLFVENEAKPVQLQITPVPLRYNQNPESLEIIGSWNDFDFQSAEPMKREKDGTFTYTVKTKEKEIAYQILNLAVTTDGGPRSVNAPGSAKYVYDGGGDYRSIVKVTSGEVVIKLNPKNIVADGGANEPLVIFSDPLHEHLRELDYVFNNTKDQLTKAILKSREDGSSVDPAEIWSPFYQVANEFMKEENPIGVRQFAALSVAKTLQFVMKPEQLKMPDEVMASMRTLLPAESPIWSAEPSLAPAVVALGRDDESAAMMELVERNPNRTVQGIALSHMVMTEFYDGDKEKAKEYYQQLKESYGDMEEVAYVLARLDPDRRIQVGNEVPDFEVALMGSGESGSTAGRVSKASMKGKYYLIDFWATWCGPCVGEMGSLHTAYEKFHSDNFEVLSLSFDASPDKVDQFREAKWGMPWLHTFVEGGFRSDLAQAFEVQGIPKPILVDPNGIIIATEGDLRGANLEKTLERYLGDGQASR